MIKILYFASLAEALNCSQEEFEIQSQNFTIENLIKELSARNEQWQQAFEKNIISAKNQETCKANAIIQDKDEIAFFPPVTGG
ncbi:MAG: molybdopterin converting factor subunit 1 [Gammaproteobacteria bacterium]|nr:molybdopterin converting factor subunit 1 [Gammaproteobacteria bacterium]